MDLPPLVLWEEIEEAVAGLNDSGSISSDKRKEGLEKIEREIAKLTAELSQASHPQYFEVNNGHITHDKRDMFYAHWCHVQGNCNAPCDPQGLSLRDNSDELEQAAYEKLGVARSIDHNTDVRPHPGN